MHNLEIHASLYHNQILRRSCTLVERDNPITGGATGNDQQNNSDLCTAIQKKNHPGSSGLLRKKVCISFFVDPLTCAGTGLQKRSGIADRR